MRRCHTFALMPHECCRCQAIVEMSTIYCIAEANAMGAFLACTAHQQCKMNQFCATGCSTGNCGRDGSVQSGRAGQYCQPCASCRGGDDSITRSCSICPGGGQTLASSVSLCLRLGNRFLPLIIEFWYFCSYTDAHVVRF